MASEGSVTAREAAAGAMGQERKKMRKVLTRFDIVFFTIAAFISLDTIAVTAAYGGGETFFWLIVTLLVWLVPYGMIIAELGSTFPVEGGPYVWPRMAFGRLAGSLTSVFYWMSNPVWMGGTLAAVVVVTINTFYLKNPMGTAASIIVGVLVVWAIVGLSLIELKWGKWTGIIGTIVRFLVLAIFLALVIAFLTSHGKPAGTVTVSSLKPSLTSFLAVIGLLQFLFVGFELSNGAAEEMKNAQRDVPTRQHVAHTGDVTGGRRWVGHDAGADGVGDGGEHDRRRGVGLDHGLGGRRGDAEDQAETLAGKLLGDRGGGRHVALRVLHVVGDVGEALLRKPFLEARDGGIERRVRDDLRDADLVCLGGGTGATAARAARAAPAAGEGADERDEGEQRQRYGQLDGTGHGSPFEATNECRIVVVAATHRQRGRASLSSVHARWKRPPSGRTGHGAALMPSACMSSQWGPALECDPGTGVRVERGPGAA
jgi:hypothetical protein